jgi:RNA recognition motif-containing protein
MTSVTASNLGTDVTEKQVNDFFSFCGKIQSLKLESDEESTQRAIITFERPSAARTALLLQDAQLGKSKVHVSSSVPLDGTHSPPSETDHHNEVSQEDKPRTAVLAEYLSHGYTLTDHALQTAIDYDHRTGLSKRFYVVLNKALGQAQGVDQKFGVTSRAATIDEKYGVQEKAKSTATGFMSYFENALGTPTGKKVRAFYDDRRKDALDIHAEARRLADERKGVNSSSGYAPVEVPAENVGTMTPGAEKLSGGDVGMI